MEEEEEDQRDRRGWLREEYEGGRITREWYEHCIILIEKEEETTHGLCIYCDRKRRLSQLQILTETASKNIYVCIEPRFCKRV